LINIEYRIEISIFTPLSYRYRIELKILISHTTIAKEAKFDAFIWHVIPLKLPSYLPYY